jgi:hypothetical protein
MMTEDVQDSIYTMLLFCFQKVKKSEMFVIFFKGRDEIHKRISGFVIMHPKVTLAGNANIFDVFKN